MMYPRVGAARRGKVAALVALSLTALLSIAAVVLDGGILLAERRHAQATADAAALAAATDLFNKYPANQGVDTSGSARSSALAVADLNGYSNDGTNSTVTVNFDPDMSAETLTAHRNPGYVEVIVEFNQQRYFSNLFGAGSIPIRARAVARGGWILPRGGVIVLDPTASGSLTVTGGGYVNVNGGEIIIDSNDTSVNGALTVSGGGLVTATAISITGSYNAPAGSLSVEPTTGVSPTPDPFRFLREPSPPPLAPRLRDMEIQPTDPIVQQLVQSGQITQAYVDSLQGKIYLLQPGRYDTSNRLQFQQNDLVIFQQASAGNGGIYYLENGFTSTGASLLMDPTTSGGIMFFNAGTGVNDSIDITGNGSGTVNLIGLSSGPYQGMLIFQARNATQPIKVTGNGSFSMLGTFYAAAATLDVTGQGSGTYEIGSQYVSDQIKISGTGTVNVNYASGIMGRQRILTLVE